MKSLLNANILFILHPNETEKNVLLIFPIVELVNIETIENKQTVKNSIACMKNILHPLYVNICIKVFV